MQAAAAQVKQVGGEVTHQLGIIQAVGAALTSNQLTLLRQKGLQVYPDAVIQTAGGDVPDPNFPVEIGADLLQTKGSQVKGLLLPCWILVSGIAIIMLKMISRVIIKFWPSMMLSE